MDKNISIKLSDLKAYLSAASKNLGWVFFIVFIILLVFEGLEVKTSLGIVSNLNQQPPIASSQRGVKINFETYQQIVKRLQSAQNFQPTGGILGPFFGHTGCNGISRSTNNFYGKFDSCFNKFSSKCIQHQKLKIIANYN